MTVYTSTGKQILRDGEHFADMVSVPEAERVTLLLNVKPPTVPPGVVSRHPIHRIDRNRLNTRASEYPEYKPGQANTDHIQHGYNIYWCDQNPELFGQSIQRALLECPPDKWDVRFLPAYMPGETWQLVATRKGLKP